MRPEFQSRRIALPRQSARELRAELHRVELDLGPLRAGQLFQGRRSNDDGTMAVPARLMEQRGGRLNEPLPHSRLVFLNNRTPDCFQRFVGEPVIAPIKEILRVLQVAQPIVGIQVRPSVSRFKAP